MIPMPELVTIGETSVVFVAKKMGRMRYSSEFEIRPGGAEATVAVGLVRMGHSAGWVSRLGNDELGYYLLTLIRGEGVDVSQVDMSDSAQTALFLRERLPAGKARHFYYRSGSAFSTMDADDLDEEYLATARIIHLSGITPSLSLSCRRLVDKALELAKKHHIPVSFDPNMRKKLWTAQKAREIMEPIFQQVDYVLPGMEDMQAIYGDDVTELEVIQHLRSLGCKSVIVKIGSRGAVVGGTSMKPIYVDGIPVENPVDLMGAGDAFAAGFIAGLLENKSLVDAAEQGNTVARISIQSPGNIESLPTRRELEMEKANKKLVDR
jgi:2-dehydro-3-deoxygluconokinase